MLHWLGWMVIVASACTSSGDEGEGSDISGEAGGELGESTGTSTTSGGAEAPADHGGEPTPLCLGDGSLVIEQLELDVTTFQVHGQDVDTSLEAAYASVVHQPCIRDAGANVELTIHFGPLQGADVESMLTVTVRNEDGTYDFATEAGSAIDLRYSWTNEQTTYPFDFTTSTRSGSAVVTAATMSGEHLIVDLSGQLGSDPTAWAFDFVIDATRP